MRPESARHLRSHVLVALPLVGALLAASLLLWSRDDPSRRGEFCANATTEIEGIALVLQDEPDRMQDVGWILNELVERVDVTRLRASVPDDLREEADLLVMLSAEHDRAVDIALAEGAEPPGPSSELLESFIVFVHRYAEDCVGTPVSVDIIDQMPAAIRRPPGGQ